MKAPNFMQKPAHLFKVILILVGLASLPAPFARTEEVVEIKKNETGLYRDIFDQNTYYEATNYLHLDRLYRDLFHKKVRSGNVNVFDEVPDSNFFTNRHGRHPLSLVELEKGYHETDGPDLSGDLVVIRGKFEGLHPGFFVKDARGEEYLVKFDPVDFLELATSAEVVASRFYYAIGYHVPQYTIALINPDQFKPGDNAMVYDDTGFKKELTQDRLTEYLLFIPQDTQGRYRASASKILAGVNKGNFSFQGRRKNDPEDLVAHEKRRELRALQVFSSWLSNYDIRESNTLDMLVEKNGRQVLRHYLIDFNTALGSGTSEGKPPMTTHEYMFDYGETTKAFLAFGFWEKTWQKRWREAGEKSSDSPAVGYFDNRYFDPGKFKTQLPHYVFKDLTRADGFWAAKIVMSFTDEDIRTMVKAGEYTRQEDADTIAKILIERRDLIGKYWFAQANPLDGFEISGNQLTFKDLAVDHGFEQAGGTVYHVTALAANGKHGKKIGTAEFENPSIDLTAWTSSAKNLNLMIRTSRAGSTHSGPFVLVEIEDQNITGITHQD